MNSGHWIGFPILRSIVLPPERTECHYTFGCSAGLQLRGAPRRIETADYIDYTDYCRRRSLPIFCDVQDRVRQPRCSVAWASSLYLSAHALHAPEEGTGQIGGFGGESLAAPWALQATPLQARRTSIIDLSLFRLPDSLRICEIGVICGSSPIFDFAERRTVNGERRTMSAVYSHSGTCWS